MYLHTHTHTQLVNLSNAITTLCAQINKGSYLSWRDACQASSFDMRSGCESLEVAFVGYNFSPMTQKLSFNTGLLMG